MLSPLLKSYNAILDSQPRAPVSEFHRSLQSILSSKSSWITTHRQRLMYAVILNVLAERHAALHFKARQLQARYLTKFEIPVALEAFIASKEVLVHRPAPPGIRPFLEINGQYRFFFLFGY